MRSGKSLVQHTVGERILRVICLVSPLNLLFLLHFTTGRPKSYHHTPATLQDNKLGCSDTGHIYTARDCSLCVFLQPHQPCLHAQPPNDTDSPVRAPGPPFPTSPPCYAPTQHFSVFSIFGNQLLFIYVRFTYLFVYKAIVLLFEEGTCKSPVCKRHWLKASRSVEQSLKTPLLVHSLFHMYIFTQLVSPLWIFFSSSPHSRFCCPRFSFFALIHTFYCRL